MSDYLGGGLSRVGDTMYVEIRPHPYVKPKTRRDSSGQRVVDPFCARCGFHQLAGIGSAFDRLWIHPDEAPEGLTTEYSGDTIAVDR